MPRVVLLERAGERTLERVQRALDGLMRHSGAILDDDRLAPDRPRFEGPME